MENKTPSVSELVEKKLRPFVDVLSASALLILYIVMIAAFMVLLAGPPPQAGPIPKIPVAKPSVLKEHGPPMCVPVGPVCEDQTNE
jgi:hypothetical protein